MNRKTLLMFAKRINSNSTEEKAKNNLLQLQEILAEQGAAEADIQLVKVITMSVRELKGLPEKPFFTENDIEIAERRARQRIAREEAAASMGRC